MSVLNIVTYPASVLRKKTRPIKRFDDHLRRPVGNMFETMAVYGGVGLAAPQVGKSKRQIVIDTGVPGGRHALVDPKMLWTAKEMEPF